MKKILSIVAISLVAIASNAQPPDVPAEKGAKFGAEVTAENALTVDKVVEKVQLNEGKKTEVKIIGEVVEVCQMKGCWITIKNGDGEITVKMKGHKWFVPSALAGKTVVIEGVAELKTTSVDELKHKAEDAGKSSAEVDAIKEAKKEIVVEAKGLLVV
jgi:hypothetical protein